MDPTTALTHLPQHLATLKVKKKIEKIKFLLWLKGISGSQLMPWPLVHSLGTTGKGLAPITGSLAGWNENETFVGGKIKVILGPLKLFTTRTKKKKKRGILGMKSCSFV